MIETVPYLIGGFFAVLGFGLIGAVLAIVVIDYYFHVKEQLIERLIQKGRRDGK